MKHRTYSRYRSYYPDGLRARAQREAQGMFQQDVVDAAQARGDPISLKSVQALELCLRPMKDSTIRAYAGALGVDPDAFLGVERCVVEAAAGDELAWQELPPGLIHIAEIVQSLANDMLGRHVEAASMADRVLAAVGDTDVLWRTRFFVTFKKASFLSNGGAHLQALELIDALLAEPAAKSKRGTHLYAWCLHHKTVILRRLERYDDALKLIARLKTRPLHKWGATHQEAVINFDLGQRTGDESRVELARLGFEQVRAALGRDPQTADHRSGLASLRLGQLLAEQGATREALDCLLESHKIFAARSSWRYLDASKLELVRMFEGQAD
jgi:tetratricopeptide (TPR) repeat protein